MLIERSIDDIINTEYREYSMYVLQQRAIPSCIDGLKPVQRKLLYSMMKRGGNKKVKIAELGGGLSSIGFHHGEASAMAAAVNMASGWDNNAPLFEGHGNFGSRIIQEAAAPRYIFATLSDSYKKYFCDEEVLEYKEDEDRPEPTYYLPVIPWVLVNGVKGIAVGFATNILPRSPEALSKACKKYIETGSLPKVLKPSFPDFKGVVEHVQGNQWRVAGVIKEEKNLTYRITELPVGNDRQGYIEFLNKLLDNDKIQDYDDLCSEKGFEFEIKVTRVQKAKIDQDPIKYFKLDTTFTENITTLDEHGNLKLFDNAVDLLQYFCDFRLKKTQSYIDFSLEELKKKIKYLQNKMSFVQAVVTGKIDLKTSKKADIVDWTNKNITTEESQVKSFLSIPFYEFAQESVELLDQKIKVENANYVSLSMVSAEQLYIKRLS